MTFPILSVIIFSPFVAALIILMMPAERKTEIRVMALMTAVFALALSLWVYLNYDQSLAGYQFIEKYDWMPMFGISLHLGVDNKLRSLCVMSGRRTINLVDLRFS